MKESINLLPQSPKGKEVVLRSVNRLTPLALAIYLIAESLFVLLLIFRLKIDRDTASLKVSLERQKQTLSQTAEKEISIREIQRRLSTIKELRRGRRSFLSAISYLPTLIPQDVSLVNIRLKPQLLEILAKTPSGMAFAKMVENINHSAKFSDLTLTGSSFDDSENLYTFNFEARVEKAIFE